MTLIDVLTAAEKSTWFFNETWFIKIIQRIESLWFLLFPAPLVSKTIRQWLGTIINSLFNKLPFMKRIAQLESNHNAYVLMQKSNHDENKILLKEIGKVVKKTSAKLRAIENDSDKAIIEFDADLNAIHCSNNFLSIVKQKTKEDVLDMYYLNCVEFSDRATLTQQLEIVKREKRKNSFPLKISTGSQAYLVYIAEVSPYTCVEGLFTGCILELNKI